MKGAAMSAALHEYLSDYPELFALLADSSVPHTEVVTVVNAELGPNYTTTEASVRRSRKALGEILLGADIDTATKATFSDKDREELHKRLDTVLDNANFNPGQVKGLRVAQWDGLTKNLDGQPEVTTLYKVDLQSKLSNLAWTERTPTLNDLALIRDYQPLLDGAFLENAGGTLVVALGDLQVGKVNEDTGAIGTDALIDRVRATTAEVTRHILTTGRRPDKIILLHAGDCIEGYTSQGGRLIKMQDLYLTEQVEVYQSILEFQALELLPLCKQLDIVVVPGNHDETTRDFETSTGDSWALFAARNATRFLVLARPDLVEKVSLITPTPGNLAVEFNAGDEFNPFFMTMVHGHKIAGSANQILQWWRNATFGNRPGAKSRLLITGHFHHFRSEAAGDGKIWLQVPAMDGGSAWFANKRGENAPPGMVTFWLDTDRAYPIQNLMIHSEG